MEYLHYQEENYFTELTVTDVLITLAKPSYHLYKPIYTTVFVFSPFSKGLFLTPILLKLLDPFICLNKNSFPAY